MRSGDDFKKQAVKLNITKWPMHDCSICGYPCGYLFRGDEVFYDSGCDCVNYTNIQPRNWEDVAEHYNMQSHPDVIKKMDEFWGFHISSELEEAVEHPATNASGH